jgi:hypothetical protein
MVLAVGARAGATKVSEELIDLAAMGLMVCTALLALNIAM